MNEAWFQRNIDRLEEILQADPWKVREKLREYITKLKEVKMEV